jgi:O-acetyl-ADP-ribose deacetylase (regulator of RNase III)
VNITVVEGDITQQDVDAVVNAANSAMRGGGGVDGAIHRAAGPRLLEECRTLGGCDTGDAKSTAGYDLPARWVIHTVGPVYDPARDLSGTLRSCYTASLAVADELGAATVAYPLISAGAFGWPLEDAVGQALAALGAAESAVEEARLVLFGAETFAAAQRVRAAS